MGKTVSTVKPGALRAVGGFLGQRFHANRVSSLIKSYRAKSHKVVSVKLLHSIISRQASLEKGKAS
jgi:hypothetical protein